MPIGDVELGAEIEQRDRRGYVVACRSSAAGIERRRVSDQLAGLLDGRMIYLKWTQSELATLEMRALYTEVDEDGWVQREVGVGSDGLIVHQLTPSDARPGWFGLARLSPLMLASNVSKAEFEALWCSGRRG